MKRYIVYCTRTETYCMATPVEVSDDQSGEAAEARVNLRDVRWYKAPTTVRQHKTARIAPTEPADGC